MVSDSSSFRARGTVRAGSNESMKAGTNWFEDEKPLNRRFAVYLPSEDKSGEPIHGLEIAIDSTMSMLCDRFGGVTSFPATGRFQRDSGSIQYENIFVLESFCDIESWNESSRFLQVWVGLLAAVLRQESIACLLDGKMVLVLPMHIDEPLEQITPNTLRELASKYHVATSQVF